MIYTCTMNPAIDLYMETDQLFPSKVNRMKRTDYQPNGKGVNVSFILKKIGTPSVALGFCGGFTGNFIKKELEKQEINTDFVEIGGVNRINVFTKINNDNSEYKMINEGPTVTEGQIFNLLAKIEKIKANDYLVVSGSNPIGVGRGVIEQIIAIAKRNGFKLLLDHSGEYVPSLICKELYLLKPNEDELLQWMGKDNATIEEMIFYSKKLIKKGVNSVLLSLGSQGAILIDECQVLKANAPEGRVVNTAGAGDTLLATYLANIQQGKDKEQSLKKAVAAGSSTAFKSGLTDFSDVNELEERVIIQVIK